MKISVIGSGSWATALVKVLSENLDSVGWYIREDEIRQSVEKQAKNALYLSDISLNNSNIKVFDNVNDAIKAAETLLFVVPSAFLNATAEQISVSLEGKKIFSAIKGIIPEFHQTAAEFFNTRFDIPFHRFGVVSGPTHAEEVALERLSYLTVATKDQSIAEEMAVMLRRPYLHTILSADLYGIEYAGVLKNIIALAAGIANGLGYGDNLTAVLVSNGFTQLKYFLDKSHPHPREASNSAYLGDLLVTCYSQFSRNRSFGTMIGKGFSVEATRLEMKMIAEGYYAVKSMVDICEKFQVELPIVSAVYNILYKNAPAKAEFDKLLKTFS